MRSAHASADWAHLIPPDRFSDLIGAIYDCSLDPELWPETIAALGEAFDCCAGVIAVTNLDPPQIRLAKTWGFPADWIAKSSDYAEEIARDVWPRVPNLDTRPLDEPGVPIRHVPGYGDTRWYREMCVPMGYTGSIHLIVMREPTRVAEFALTKHESRGMVTDRDIDLMRLFAPHIRRAVNISDVIDMKRLEAQAFGATIDNLAVGVVIVAEHGRILHANDAARRMLDDGALIVSTGGRLAALHRDVSRELLKAIALAQSETEIGGVGIGVPLLDGGLAAATAHVLPLARGDLRTRLMPQATAAVFIAEAGTPLPSDLNTVARVFGLTPAETTLLERLVAGATMSEAAAGLGIAMSTVRTHRDHIFAKMGVSRRSEMADLVHRLVPPVRAA